MTCTLLLAASCLATSPIPPSASSDSTTSASVSAFDTAPLADPAAAALERAYGQERETVRVRDTDTWNPGGSYLRLMGGLMSMEDSEGPSGDIEFDEGYLVSIAFGQRMSSGVNPLNFDLELEGVWSDTDTDEDGPIMAVSDVTTIGGFLNGIVDLRLADRFSLYGGAGIGMAWMDIGTESDAINDFEDEDGPFLAWQLKAGLMWRTSRDIALVLGYRFVNVDDVNIDDDLGGAEFDLETEQHVVEAGLRFGF
jgi:opacity protein-like surface antigen